ncbi:MAG: glycosyltransferase family 2 protein [Gallionellaceae bacterium]|jgi:glycosyltransferase involved in cell wall biosynthesis
MTQINIASSAPITPEISILIPAFNEAQGILTFLERLFAMMNSVCLNFEIWVIDDGSSDATWGQLSAAQAHYPQLHGVRFTRNFGKEAAILAGLRHAQGKAVIVMDADGQHPVEILPDMINLWRNGKAQIVAGQKASRVIESFKSRVNSFVFNKLMRALTGLDLSNASDFKLLDRHVVEVMLAFPEKVRFFRGMTVWTGFNTHFISFDVSPRLAGNSHWSNAQLMQLAVTAITSFSAKPLGLVLRLGFLGMIAAFLLLIQAIYSWFAGIAISGWTSLTVVVLFFGSANLMAIGILGAYLAQLFNEIKARPEFLVREQF